MPASLAVSGNVAHIFSIPTGAAWPDGCSPGLERARIAVRSAMLDPVIFPVNSGEGLVEAGRPALWVACTSGEW